MPRYIVKTCKVNTLRSIKALYLHVQLYHKRNLKGKMMCPEHQCLRDYNGWQSFRRHLTTFHKFRSVTSNNSNVKNTDNCKVSNADNYKVLNADNYKVSNADSNKNNVNDFDENVDDKKTVNLKMFVNIYKILLYHLLLNFMPILNCLEQLYKTS